MGITPATAGRERIPGPPDRRRSIDFRPRPPCWRTRLGVRQTLKGFRAKDFGYWAKRRDSGGFIHMFLEKREVNQGAAAVKLL